jgi:hypothetical protein
MGRGRGNFYNYKKLAHLKNAPMARCRALEKFARQHKLNLN